MPIPATLVLTRLLRQEAIKYVKELDDIAEKGHTGKISKTGKRCHPYRCRFCYVQMPKLAKMRRHALAHIKGKLSIGLSRTGKSTQRSPHPKLLALARALYDNDILTGVVCSRYLNRISDLVMKWNNTDKTYDDMTVYALCGNNDRDLRLTFTENGPQYWSCSSHVGVYVRDLYNVSYTRCFANLFCKDKTNTMVRVSSYDSCLLYTSDAADE